MKNTLFIAVVALAGCAAPQASVGPGEHAAVSPASQYYCAKHRLVPDGDRLSCNWESSAEEACRFTKTTVLERTMLAGDPQPAGRCSTGDWLVKAKAR